MNKINLEELVKDSIDSLKSARQRHIELGRYVKDWDDEKKELFIADDCIEFREKMGLDTPEKIQAYQDKRLQEIGK
jgi:hypothetical protein